MGIGVMEAFIFLLVFGLNAVGEPSQPANPAEVMRYAPAQADVFVHANIDAIVQPGWKWLNDLQNEAFIKNSPDVSRELANGLQKIEGAAKAFEQETGVDLFKDIQHASFWYRADSATDDDAISLLFSIKGSFKADLLESAVKGKGSHKTIGGNTVYFNSSKDFAAFQIGTDYVLLGSPSLVEARAEKGFAAPMSSQIKRWKKKLQGNPVIVLSVEPGANLRGLIKSEGAPASISGIVEGLSFLDIGLFAKGIDIDLDASSQDSYERFTMFFDGIVDLCRATQTSTRGVARTVLAILSESDPSLPPPIRLALKDRKALLNFILKHTGEGDFKLNNTSNNASMALRYEMRAGHVREVLQPMILFAVAAVLF